MTIGKVREHLKQWGRDQDILEFDVSSATVELAAQALNCEPSRIAKTLSYKTPGNRIVIVTAGDARTDNKKYKNEFGTKARMLSREEVLDSIGHDVGGVCPFGLNEDVKIFLDISLKRFETIFPACGSANSAIELTCDELAEYSGYDKWVDVCKDWSKQA